MTLRVTHPFEATAPETEGARADGRVVTSDWNDDHTLRMASGMFLGRLTAGTGAVEELTPTQVKTALEILDLFTGSYNDLLDLPVLFDGAYSSLSGKPTLFSGSFNDLTDVPPALGFSGDYYDLTNLPTLGSVAATDILDYATAAQGAKADSALQSIADASVTMAKLADVATQTIVGRTAIGTGVPKALTATEATAILDAAVGDAGSGGTKGLVPAPTTGDATKFLRGDMTFQTIVTTQTYQIEIIIGDGVSVISTGAYPTAAIRFPRNATITGWYILSCDAATPTSGSIVFDLWKDTQANYPPTVGDTIIPSGTKPTLTTATQATFSSLTGWTLSASAGDILFVNVDSVTSLKTAKLIITYTG